MANAANIIKKSFALFLSIIVLMTMVPLNVFATETTTSILSGTCGENATYTYDESAKILTISGFGAIADSAFTNYENADATRETIAGNVKTVIINDGITEIGSYAFDCCKCTSIKLPNSLEIIRRGAFYCCRITSIEIPNTVTTIERAAFNMCQELVNVKLSAHIDTIKELTFSGCSKLESINIPNSVKKIEKNSFANCCSSNLVLNIPCNVELEFNTQGILGSMGYANSFCGTINVVSNSVQEQYFLNNYANEISKEKITFIKSLSHSFSNRVEKESGIYVETCSVCGEEKTLECHNLTKYEGLEATCLEDGLKEYWFCDICNRYFTDKTTTVEILEDIETWKTIQADGHNYYWYNTDSMGENAYDLSCSECNENFGRGYLNSDNQYHMYGYVENGDYYHYIYDENAECLGSEKCEVDYWYTDESYHEGICKCHLIVCEETLHNESPWIIDKAATCTEPGSKYKECTVCNAVLETVEIVATGHTTVVDEAVAPTCTTTGLTEGSHCSVCNKVISAQEVVLATGHIAGNWIIDKESNCTENGSKHIDCLTCGETIETVVIIATGHASTDWIIDKPAICTEKGAEHKECTVCDKILETAEIPVKSHTEVKDNAVAATCTTDGKTEGSHCSVCKTVIKAQKTVAKKGHTTSKWITTKKATVTAAGSKYQKCTVCGVKIKTAKIAQLKCAAPKLKAVSNVATGIKLTWNKVTGADNYEIYRKTGNGAWKKLATVKGTVTTYTDKTAKSGTTYKYTVKAKNEAGLSGYNTTGLTIKCLADPVLKAPTSTKSGITLKWNKVTGAQGYVVYRQIGNGKLTKIATVKGVSKVSYTDKSAKKGTKYTYKLQAYSGKTYSAYSNAKTIKDKY